MTGKIILLIVKTILQKRKIILGIVAEETGDSRLAVAQMNPSPVTDCKAKPYTRKQLIYSKIGRL